MVSKKASASKRAKLGDKLVKKATAATARKEAAAAEEAAAVAAATPAPPKRGASPAGTSSDGEGGDEEGRVLYIGHLPHGFYEAQLRGYFSQFGAVTRVRVSRNKKTAKAKHYAFLEFASPAVARVAADAMDGYLMFASRLAVKVVPPSRVHPALFKGANRTFTKVPWRKIEADRHNADRDAEKEAARASRAAARDRKRAAKIKKAGLEYEYDVLDAAAVPATPDVSAKKKKAVKATAPASSPATRGVRKRAAAADAAPQPAAKVKAAAKKAAVETKQRAPRAAAAKTRGKKA